MIDWTKSMQQTFEYYIVDPITWKDKSQLLTVKKSSINRDSTVETLGSATIDMTEAVGECYIRIYLIAIQNGVRHKEPLGTFLVQTPSTSFDGKLKNISVDAYTPLLELKENPPPLGYYIRKGDNLMETAYRLTNEHMRAPVIKTESDVTVYDNFVSNTSDTWLSYLSDLIYNAKYEYMLDELGRVVFAPKQDTASLQPVWTFDDSNSSILYPELTLDHDIYGIPNVVEAIYSNGGDYYHARVVNDDPNSITSTVSRGREIVYRDTNPTVAGVPTQEQVERYAEQLLRDLSSIDCTISYSHGYCPVRLGDCVRLNYTKAGMTNIKAKVISQSITCEQGCKVTEKAVFTAKLWR